MGFIRGLVSRQIPRLPPRLSRGLRGKQQAGARDTGGQGLIPGWAPLLSTCPPPVPMTLDADLTRPRLQNSGQPAHSETTAQKPVERGGGCASVTVQRCLLRTSGRGRGGAHQVPRGRILLSLEKFLRRSRFSKEDSDVCPFSKPRMVEIYASCSWISNLPKVECFSSGNGLLLSFKKWIIFLFWSQLSPSEKTPAFKRRKCRRTNFLLCLT